MTGRQGENLAALYLLMHGYRILDRNYHSRVGERDIVATRFNTLVFVEVKARGENAVSTPASAVDIYKQRKIIKTAQYYMFYKNIAECDVRFDVLELIKIGNHTKFNHIKNAFEC